MFIGEYNHSVDTKGRLSIPAKFRDNLGEGFILTKGLDNCLFVYPLDEWKIFEDKLKQLPMANRDARSFVRFFFAGATECEFDNQGRIRIPINLRDHASIKKEAVIIGVATRLEIWSTEEWTSYNDEITSSYDEIALKMQELGI